MAQRFCWLPAAATSSIKRAESFWNSRRRSAPSPSALRLGILHAKSSRRRPRPGAASASSSQRRGRTAGWIPRTGRRRMADGIRSQDVRQSSCHQAYLAVAHELGRSPGGNRRWNGAYAGSPPVPRIRGQRRHRASIQIDRRTGHPLRGPGESRTAGCRVRSSMSTGARTRECDWRISATMPVTRCASKENT